MGREAGRVVGGDLGTPTLDGDVLLALARADAAFTGGDLARLIPGASSDGVRKAAQRLVEQGTVVMERVGRANNYRLNRDHLMADAIIEIARASTRLEERVHQHVDGWAAAPQAVVLFGSAARAEMRPGSDIDLLVVGSGAALEDAASALVDAMHTWTGNDVRVLHLSVRELRQGLRRADELVEQLLDDGQVLWGPPRYLQHLKRDVVA